MSVVVRSPAVRASGASAYLVPFDLARLRYPGVDDDALTVVGFGFRFGVAAAAVRYARAGVGGAVDTACRRRRRRA